MYVLRYWQLYEGEKTVVNISAQENSYTIEGLTPSTQYSVDIQAVTKIGCGLRTEANFESGVTPGLLLFIFVKYYYF